MEVSEEVDEIHEFCKGAGGSPDVVDKELGDAAGEQGLLNVTNEKAGIAGGCAIALDYTFKLTTH